MLARYCEVAGVRLPIATTDMAAMIMAYVDGVARLQRLSIPQLPATLLSDGLVYLWTGVNAGPTD